MYLTLSIELLRLEMIRRHHNHKILFYFEKEDFYGYLDLLLLRLNLKQDIQNILVEMNKIQSV